MTTINERLSEYLKAEKIPDRDVYKKIGVGQSVFGGWIKQGRAIPLNKVVSILVLFPNLNARWLLTGSGEMIDKQVSYPENNSLYIAEENKVVQVSASEFDRILASKEETILSQKVTIKVLSEMLGNDLLTDEQPSHDGKPKKQRIKGFRSVGTLEFESMIERMVSDMKRH